MQLFDANNEEHMKHLHQMCNLMHKIHTLNHRMQEEYFTDYLKEKSKECWQNLQNLKTEAPYVSFENLYHVTEIPRLITDATSVLSSLYFKALKTRSKSRVQEALRVLHRRRLPMNIVSQIAMIVVEIDF